ncbi:hypothetical protein F4782DRAFT_533760 [Xylaria castorea]|nr:hypothetical protein F4782DRAFT_533760 [Xylaria castorea]
MPDPTPAAKPIFKTDPVPTDWSSKTDNQKLDWLNSQGLPSDPTINLGDCYRRDSRLTRIFSIIFRLLRRLGETVAAKLNKNLNKFFNAFITALNLGVGRLSNYIYSHCVDLLRNGKFVDGMIALLPVALPDLPLLDDNSGKLPSPTTPLKDSFWGIFLDTLSVLTESWPWLQTVEPTAGLSYAQVLKTCVEAGQTFFQEYQKAWGEHLQDEADRYVFVLVANAASDGLSRNIQPKRGESPDDDRNNGDIIIALEDLQVLIPAWGRVL